MNDADTKQVDELRKKIDFLLDRLDEADARAHEMTERADRDLARAVDLNRELRRARQKQADTDAVVQSLTEMCENLRGDLAEAQERAMRAEADTDA